MIIATSQDVILIGCCSCHPAACDAPRIDSQVVHGDLGSEYGPGFGGDGTETSWSYFRKETSTYPGASRVVVKEWSRMQFGTLPDGSSLSMSLNTTSDTGDLTGWTGGINYAYADPITYSGWVSESRGLITANIATLVDGDWTSGGAVSSYSFTNPDPGSAYYFANRLTLNIEAARYKIGIPEAWADFSGRHATWVTDHATWVSADPDTRGPEPVEPVERTVFECQWDEYFFPPEWDAWKAIKDEFAATTAAHDAWAACEALTPGDCGDEPTISATPGDEPTAPSLVTHQSWSYGGTDEFSDWFEIAVPEAKGQTRVVNMLVKCYHSTRLGVKPTASGEVYKP